MVSNTLLGHRMLCTGQSPEDLVEWTTEFVQIYLLGRAHTPTSPDSSCTLFQVQAHVRDWLIEGLLNAERISQTYVF